MKLLTNLTIRSLRMTRHSTVQSSTIPTVKERHTFQFWTETDWPFRSRQPLTPSNNKRITRRRPSCRLIVLLDRELKKKKFFEQVSELDSSRSRLASSWITKWTISHRLTRRIFSECHQVRPISYGQANGPCHPWRPPLSWIHRRAKSVRSSEQPAGHVSPPLSSM